MYRFGIEPQDVSARVSATVPAWRAQPGAVLASGRSVLLFTTQRDCVRIGRWLRILPSWAGPCRSSSQHPYCVAAAPARLDQNGRRPVTLPPAKVRAARGGAWPSVDEYMRVGRAVQLTCRAGSGPIGRCTGRTGWAVGGEWLERRGREMGVSARERPRVQFS